MIRLVSYMSETNNGATEMSIPMKQYAEALFNDSVAWGIETCGHFQRILRLIRNGLHKSHALELEMGEAWAKWYKTWPHRIGDRALFSKTEIAAILGALGDAKYLRIRCPIRRMSAYAPESFDPASAVQERITIWELVDQWGDGDGIIHGRYKRIA